MPRKKRNWEIENFGVHNTPEQFYFTFGKFSPFSNNLFKTPSVTINRVLQDETVDKGHKNEGHTFYSYEYICSCINLPSAQSTQKKVCYFF